MDCVVHGLELDYERIVIDGLMLSSAMANIASLPPGQTAAEWALQRGREDVVEFLRNDAEIEKTRKEAQEAEDDRKGSDKEMKKGGQDAEKAGRNQKKNEEKSSPG